MKKATKFGIVALLLVGLVGSAIAFPFGGRRAGFESEDFEVMKEKMEAKRDEVKAAIEANDYNAWLSAIEDHPRAEKLTEVINEDNFDKFVEMHNHMEEARQIADELGIERPGKGMHKRMHRFGHRMSFE